MTRLAATTALALALTLPGYAALAQTQSTTQTEAQTEAGVSASSEGYFAAASDSDVFGSDFLGQDIYVTEAEEEMAEGDQPDADDATEWESIGEVSDVILTSDSQVKAVLVDVGGFLGMGGKTVAISMDQLAWETESDDPDDRFLTLTSGAKTLNNAPEFEDDRWAERAELRMNQAGEHAEAAAENIGAEAGELYDEAAAEVEEAAEDTRAAAEHAAAETGAAIDEMAEETEQAMDETAAEADQAMDEAAAETEQAMDEAAAETDEAMDETAAAAEAGFDVDAEGYAPVAAASLTADAVTGATVYDVSNEDIGEVVDLVMGQDGQINEAILDVGGFLGLGEHRVAVPLEKVKMMQADDDPDDVRVYVGATKDQLKQMPKAEIQG